MTDIDIVTNDRHAGRQDYLLNRIIKLGSTRLRTEIRRDFYDFQSYARISLWDGTKWNVVASIDGLDEQMKAGPSSSLWNTRREACVQWQEDVAERLLTTARAVIA